MIESGSQIILCNLPIRLDTYKGCSHGCKYCFVSKRIDINEVVGAKSVSTLMKFIKGGRTSETNWCDWGIPLHWGGMSDPFQPIEKKYKTSLDCLKVFAETKYPFVVSTKGVLLSKPPYIDLLKECNVVTQISLVSPKYDKLEPGTGGYKERFDMLPILAKNSKRLIVRVQPYIREVKYDVLKHIKEWKEQGVYGVAFEGIKMSVKTKGMISVGNETLYPVELLEKDFKLFRDECHKHGLKFLAAENRLRYMGDGLTCCGCDDLEGFRVCKANLNYYLFDKENLEFTKSMKNPGTAPVFTALIQNNFCKDYFKRTSYKDFMEHLFNDGKVIRGVYGRV